MLGYTYCKCTLPHCPHLLWLPDLLSVYTGVVEFLPAPWKIYSIGECQMSNMHAHSSRKATRELFVLSLTTDHK